MREAQGADGLKGTAEGAQLLSVVSWEEECVWVALTVSSWWSPRVLTA
jgi:hypothetical protein